MNLRNVIALNFLLLIANFASAQTPFFIMPSEYNMEMVFQNDRNERESNHVFFDGKNIRTEMKIQGETIITIVRRDKNILYQLNPDRKEYTEILLPTDFQSIEDIRKDANWKFLGTKKGLDGQEVEKYEGTAYTGGEKVTFVYWIDRSTKLPVRRTINGETVDFYNIRAGAQDPKLFEIPKEFKRVEAAQNQFQAPLISKPAIRIPANQSQEAR